MKKRLTEQSLLGVLNYWVNRAGYPPDSFMEAGAHAQLKTMIKQSDKPDKTVEREWVEILAKGISLSDNYGVRILEEALAEIGVVVVDAEEDINEQTRSI